MKGRILLPLLAVLLTGVSCLGETEKVTSPQAAITSFTIGYYPVRVHDINWHGRDTIIYETQGGVMYPMTIDQLNNEIYNIDSLAYGSDISAVTSTVVSTGTLFYCYADNTDESYLWSSYDSIDFTRRLLFTVVSTDGTYTRKYNVKVNVRTVFPDSLIWSDSDDTGFPVLTDMSVLERSDTIFCFGKDASGAASVTYRKVVNENWNGANQINGFSAADWKQGVTLCAGRFYTVSDGTLYGSTDGINWSSVKTGVKNLFVSLNDDGLLWAVSGDNEIIRTSDMTEWVTVQSVPEGFPCSSTIITSYPLATNANITRWVLVGVSDDNPYASVWTMLTGDTVWTQVDAPDRTELRLPAVQNLSMIRYDGDLFCFGRGSEWFRQSCDNGITWYECNSYTEEFSSWNRYMQLPDAIKGSDIGLACTVDSKGSIWIMTEDGQVWRGAINRLNRR